MEKFNQKIQSRLNTMAQSGKLFKSKLTGDQIWEIYINSFDADPIFRDPNSTSHNCNHCKNFIRRYGNIVSISNEYEIVTMFDISLEEGGDYFPSAKAISTALKNAPIVDVFFETFDELNSLPYENCSKKNTVFQLGVNKNVKRYTKEEAEKFGVVKPNEIRTFHHIHVFMPEAFVDKTGKSVDSIMSDYRSAKEVFERGMSTISIDTLVLVKDLINQGSLLDGQTHLYKIDQMIAIKKEYDTRLKSMSPLSMDVWCWDKSYKFQLAKFRNELIGTLCVELSEGKELNESCQAWNKRVDPANYMKATAPITRKQIEDAKRFVEDNGYEASFNRRFATIRDINVAEILHSNVGTDKLKTASIFDNVKSTSTQHKRSEFDGIEEVGIEKFMKDILPGCTQMEVFLQNNHEKNMVSLTTAEDPESKPIFKWSNNYSWTYNGNLAGKSQIKDAVKSRGGSVDGVLRVSLSFPNTTDDYDLHMHEPRGMKIDYSSLRVKFPSSGMLDLDAQGRDGHQPSEKRVENIIYTDKSKMPKGEYKIIVNNYSRRGLHTAFSIEIEIDGEITVIDLKKPITLNAIEAATISFDGENYKVFCGYGMEVINSKSISKEIYGLETNKFHKVSLACLSPNHWGNNNSGNKHYMFMLHGCKAQSATRSFHNENLIPELMQHRKVMEVLGNQTMINPTEDQLSGLGFNATVKDEIVVRLSGTHKRTLKIKL